MRASTTHAVDSSPAVRYPRFAARTTDTGLGPERGEPGAVQRAGPSESGGLGWIDVHWRAANYLSVGPDETVEPAAADPRVQRLNPKDRGGARPRPLPYEGM